MDDCFHMFMVSAVCWEMLHDNTVRLGGGYSNGPPRWVRACSLGKCATHNVAALTLDGIITEIFFAINWDTTESGDLSKALKRFWDSMTKNDSLAQPGE